MKKTNKEDSTIILPKTKNGLLTPTTVESFRENLRRYYYTDKTSLFCSYDKKEIIKIPIDEISSFDDIYAYFKKYQAKTREEHLLRLNSGEGYVGYVFVLPMLYCNEKKFDKIVNKCLFNDSNIDLFEMFFRDKKNFAVYEYFSWFLEPKDFEWELLSSIFYRPFYAMTLGKFSGYSLYDDYDATFI